MRYKNMLLPENVVFYYDEDDKKYEGANPPINILDIFTKPRTKEQLFYIKTLHAGDDKANQTTIVGTLVDNENNKVIEYGLSGDIKDKQNIVSEYNIDGKISEGLPVYAASFTMFQDIMNYNASAELTNIKNEVAEYNLDYEDTEITSDIRKIVDTTTAPTLTSCMREINTKYNGYISMITHEEVGVTLTEEHIDAKQETVEFPTVMHNIVNNNTISGSVKSTNVYLEGNIDSEYKIVPSYKAKSNWFVVKKGWNTVVSTIIAKDGNILAVYDLMTAIANSLNKHTYDLFEIAVTVVGDRETAFICDKNYQSDVNSEANFLLGRTGNKTEFEPIAFNIKAKRDINLDLGEVLKWKLYLWIKTILIKLTK